MYFDSDKNGPAMYDVVNLRASLNPPKWQSYAEVTVPKNTAKIQWVKLKNPIFPGGQIVPVVGAEKMIYKVAAFFPKDSRLGSLSDLGKLWVSHRMCSILPFAIKGINPITFKPLKEVGFSYA
jgi:hypothetical protein